MRTPLIVANWKMNHTIMESLRFVVDLKRQGIPPPDKAEIVICPSFLSLYPLSVELEQSTAIRLGAQNCHWENSGAFTGEVSPQFLGECHCEYVILGHSERRRLFGETDEIINKKIFSVLKAGMSPIFCIGETDDQRNDGKTESVVKNQLEKGLSGLAADDLSGLVIAYEPVWAIGTGQTATPAQAEEVHKIIRRWIAQKFNAGLAENMRIIYGGSVKGVNISSLMKEPDIDGALAGNASLEVDSFLKIVNFRG